MTAFSESGNEYPKMSALLSLWFYSTIWGNLNFSDTLLPWLNSSQRSKFINRMWQLLSFTHPLLLCRINSWPWSPCRSWSLCSHQTDTSWPLRLKPAWMPVVWALEWLLSAPNFTTNTELSLVSSYIYLWFHFINRTFKLEWTCLLSFFKWNISFQVRRLLQTETNTREFCLSADHKLFSGFIVLHAKSESNQWPRGEFMMGLFSCCQTCNMTNLELPQRYFFLPSTP